jgi:hypothetical protein
VGDPGINGGIKSKWILGDRRDSIGAGYDPLMVFCDHGNDPKGIFKTRMFLISWVTKMLKFSRIPLHHEVRVHKISYFI